MIHVNSLQVISDLKVSFSEITGLKTLNYGFPRF